MIRALFQRLTGPTLPALALSALLVLLAGPAAAADESATELAKQSQNPIANVINVPFQNNFNSFPDREGGRGHGCAFTIG